MKKNKPCKNCKELFDKLWSTWLRMSDSEKCSSMKKLLEEAPGEMTAKEKQGYKDLAETYAQFCLEPEEIN